MGGPPFGKRFGIQAAGRLRAPVAAWGRRRGRAVGGGRVLGCGVRSGLYNRSPAHSGQSWQDYKAELLRVRGLNVMCTAEYQMVSQMGVFPFLH